MAAADVAKMVDMSPTEVADLLGQGSHNSPGATDAAALAQEVVCVLVQLESVLCAGMSASQQPQSVGLLLCCPQLLFASSVRCSCCICASCCTNTTTVRLL